MYDVRILDEPAAEMARLDKVTSARILKKVKWLAENVEQIRPERLRGDLADFMKLRVGDYRVLYEILPEENSLIVHKVGHRSEVYKIA